MSALQITSLGFGAICLIAVALIVLGVLRGFTGSNSTENFDQYLRSDQGNKNPPHIPATYSPEVEDRTGWFTVLFSNIRSKGIVQKIDRPELQKTKFESSQTTTTKELSAIER